ncbi:MAG: hypothetical protein ABSH01_23895 [Terriglobia bacterium]|jgi:hypothetical protein
MKATGYIEKWGAGVLGAVSLALLVNLVVQINRGHAGDRRPRATTPPRAKATTLPSAKAPAGKQSVSDELSRYDPVVKLDLLKELEGRPLPELDRNPFEFVGAPANATPAQTAAAAPAAQPPPPPPVTLKPMGYSEGKGGVKEAMVSDEDQVFVVHEGDSIGTRYKVIKITPTVITVEDATIHQTVDLPVPP